MCHIAEILISLQEAGNVKYTEWNLQVPSNAADDIISDLQKLAISMEEELDVWKHELSIARLRFYELNYYTTAQLLVLRKELGACKKLCPKIVLSPDILALLQSVSCEVVFDNVHDAISEVMSIQDSRNVTFEIKEDKEEQEVKKESNIRASSTLPPPDSNLTPEQKEIKSYVKKKLNCPDSLILKAFEECHEQGWNRYDYVKWCSDHLDDISLHEDAIDEEMDSDFCDTDSESSERISIFSPGKKNTSGIRIRYLASPNTLLSTTIRELVAVIMYVS